MLSALDNDLQAKLAARRERAETGALPSAQGGASGGGRGSVDDLRAPVDTVFLLPCSYVYIYV